jgi:hypothetical protein
LSANDGGTYVVSSTQDGSFYVTVAPGIHYYRVEKDTYCVAEGMFDAATSDMAIELNVRLAVGNSLVGRVATADGGMPVPDALVRLSTANGLRVFSSVTGEDGAYSITSVPDGVYRVSIFHSSLAFSPVDVSLAPNGISSDWR